MQKIHLPNPLIYECTKVDLERIKEINKSKSSVLQIKVQEFEKMIETFELIAKDQKEVPFE